MTLPINQFGAAIQRRQRYATRTSSGLWFEYGDVMMGFCALYVSAIYVKISPTIVPAGNLTVRVWDTKKGPSTNTAPLNAANGGEDILVVESASLAPGDMFSWEPPPTESIYQEYAGPGGEKMAKEVQLGWFFEQGVRVQVYDDAQGGTGGVVGDSMRLTSYFYI